MDFAKYKIFCNNINIIFARIVLLVAIADLVDERRLTTDRRHAPATASVTGVGVATMGGIVTMQ